MPRVPAAVRPAIVALTLIVAGALVVPRAARAQSGRLDAPRGVERVDARATNARATDAHAAAMTAVDTTFAGDASTPARAARAGPPAGVAAQPAARIDLPFLDLPYNGAYGGRAPSMQQSLDVTTGVYDAAHLGIARAFGRRRVLGKVTIAAFDVFGVAVPFTDAWLHEEWHRAVLGARGVGSYDDVYTFDLGATSISVSHTSDADLARMKREHPAEFVRLKAAGIEGEYAMVTRLEQEQFYRGGRAWHQALYWFTAINSVLYVADTSGIDAETRKMNTGERTVAVRDISGHDFTAWVRDLFRPGEPWEARGVHPSGLGVNRYVLTTDLTPEERQYLHHEGRLAFLNFADPNLLGMHGVTLRSPVGGGPLRANFALRHLLTSFGHTVDANVFLQQGPANLFVVLHGYANHERSFPGADAELLDYPVTLAGRVLELSPRLALWTQPAAQQFRTQDARVGALAALRVRAPLTRRFGTLVEVEAKTPGWVAGVAQLDRAVNLRVGASVNVW